MRRPKHQLPQSRANKVLISLLILAIILIGIIIWLLLPDKNHTASQPVTTIQTTDKETSFSNESSKLSTSSATKSSNEKEKYPYAVTSQQLQPKMTFQLAEPDSPNMPTYVVLDFDKEGTGKAEIVFKKSDGQDSTANEKFTLSEIPTKEIRIFPAFNQPTDEQSLRNSIRTVKVNTKLTLYSGDKMYLFVNGNQGISLITKNFAGNVPQDLTDVYVESFEEKIYRQALDDSTKEKIAQYKKQIEEAFIAQQNYAETLDSSAKESVQSPQAAAVAKATELGIAHPEDNELIQKALSEFHE